MKTTIAILVHNEAVPLGRLLKELEHFRFFIGHLGATCCFIDDGSSDESRLLIERAGWQCISHPQRIGIASCIETAYTYAADCLSTHLMLFPGNGRVSPAEIGSFLQAAISAPDSYIVGNRFLVDGRTTLRRKLVWWLNRLLHRITRGKINDVTSLTRVMPMGLLHNRRLALGYRGEHQIHQIVLTEGYGVVELPIHIDNPDDRKYSHFGIGGQLSVLLQWMKYILAADTSAA